MSQAQIEQSVAASLTNAALAVRLRMITTNVRTFSKGQRDAFLYEAARRLDVAERSAVVVRHVAEGGAQTS